MKRTRHKPSFIMEWNDRFLELLADSQIRYREGNRTHQDFFSQEEVLFLASIGYKPREMFDFVEDFVEEGVPSPSTALLIASVRRDYFLTTQKGVSSSTPLITAMDLPGFGDMLEGIPYLPRIIAKARGKLRGELDPDVMFCCGGDRKFLREHGNISPADFLRHIWAAHEDTHAIVHFVKNAQS